jgi:hypothetical protein
MRCQFCKAEINKGSFICEWCGRRHTVAVPMTPQRDYFAPLRAWSDGISPNNRFILLMLFVGASAAFAFLELDYIFNNEAFGSRLLWRATAVTDIVSMVFFVVIFLPHSHDDHALIKKGVLIWGLFLAFRIIETLDASKHAVPWYISLVSIVLQVIAWILVYFWWPTSEDTDTMPYE